MVCIHILFTSIYIFNAPFQDSSKKSGQERRKLPGPDSEGKVLTDLIKNEMLGSELNARRMAKKMKNPPKKQRKPNLPRATT